jgi:hypothetical protein
MARSHADRAAEYLGRRGRYEMRRRALQNRLHQLRRLRQNPPPALEEVTPRQVHTWER